MVGKIKEIKTKQTSKATVQEMSKEKKVIEKVVKPKAIVKNDAISDKKNVPSKKTIITKKAEVVSKPMVLNELTDDDILRMPNSDYMNDIQLMFFKLKLEQLKNRLLTSAGLTTDHLRQDASLFPDPADRATVEEEHALELRTRDRERKLLKKVEQAIERIGTGEYGYCDETGEEIGVGRLLARPTATLSIEAQQRRELKQKMFGD